MNNLNLNDIITTSGFVTAYRAYDVCHNINNVLKIRSINNLNYDINIPNFKNVYYYEESINGQKIPLIYGDNNSYINFPNLITNSSYTICTITKYIGTNQNLQNSILTYSDNSNNISIGHYNKWAGIVYNNDTTYKSSDSNNNNNWVITCFSFDVNNKSNIIFSSTNKPTGTTYTNINNLPLINNGKLAINNNTNINLNSQWALSHLFVFNSALPLDSINKIYSSMSSYLSKPATNDLILYKDVYPRNLPSCISENFNNNNSGVLNIDIPIWAGYFAGDYNPNLNVLPEMTGNKTRDLSSDKLKNILFDASNKIIYGYRNSSVVFPENSLNSKFTICTITKYLSNDPTANNMIIQSTNNTGEDNNLFYHGHYKNKKGVIMYDNFELSKGFPSTEPSNSWVVTCAKNTNSSINPTNNVLINDNYQGLYLEKNYSNVSKTLSINNNNNNNNNNTSFNSDWALSYILIWNDWLSDTDLKKVSTALNNYINTGIKINFNSNSNPTVTPTTSPNNANTNTNTNNFICPGLNLTSLQKKMLLI